MVSTGYSKLPTHHHHVEPKPKPLTPLQQKAYDSVFRHKRDYSPLQQQYSYNPSSIKQRQGAIRPKSKTPSGSKKVTLKVSRQRCPSGTSPDFRVEDKDGKRINLVPFLRYLYDTRNTYCKNQSYPNFVWDATIDKYCCSENPEDKMTRLNHLLDALENGVGNVDVNSDNSHNFDLIKSEINKIFKFFFPDDTGFDLETDQRNLDIRVEVEEKLDRLIFENDTGEPTRRLLSPEFIRWFDTYVDFADEQKDPENFPDISETHNDPDKALKVATFIEKLASKQYSAREGKPPTDELKRKFIQDVLRNKLPYYNKDVDYRSYAWTEDILPTTRDAANFNWKSLYRRHAILPSDKDDEEEEEDEVLDHGSPAKHGGRQYHLKKKYKSKSRTKFNTKNTRRIRRKSKSSIGRRERLRQQDRSRGPK